MFLWVGIIIPGGSSGVITGYELTTDAPKYHHGGRMGHHDTKISDFRNIFIFDSYGKLNFTSVHFWIPIALLMLWNVEMGLKAHS